MAPKITVEQLQQRVIECRMCPRLVEFREKVAREKRRAFQDWDYWGKPVPSFGDPRALLLIVGLAPGAHGANRTGRMFTGDSSGDFLYSTLKRFGFCNQAESTRRNDGLVLQKAYITAAVRCVPPANKPARQEMDNCRVYLRREIELLREVKVVVALGQIAWTAYLKARRELNLPLPSPLPKFRHGTMVALENDLTLIASYHPSRQNTQTGRLTAEMFDKIFRSARQIVKL